MNVTFTNSLLLKEASKLSFLSEEWIWCVWSTASGLLERHVKEVFLWQENLSVGVLSCMQYSEREKNDEKPGCMPFDEKSRDSTLRNYLLAGGMRGSGWEKRKKNNIFLLDWKSSINIIELKTRFGVRLVFSSLFFLWKWEASRQTLWGRIRF